MRATMLRAGAKRSIGAVAEHRVHPRQLGQGVVQQRPAATTSCGEMPPANPSCLPFSGAGSIRERAIVITL